MYTPFESDLINNMDHMRILGTEPSSVILSHIPYIGIFRASLIFAEFATSLKSSKIDTAKNKPYYTSSLRVLEIAKRGLRENLTSLPSAILAKFSRRKKFPIYGNLDNKPTKKKQRKRDNLVFMFKCGRVWSFVLRYNRLYFIHK